MEFSDVLIAFLALFAALQFYARRRNLEQLTEQLELAKELAPLIARSEEREHACTEFQALKDKISPYINTKEQIDCVNEIIELLGCEDFG